MSSHRIRPALSGVLVLLATGAAAAAPASAAVHTSAHHRPHHPARHAMHTGIPQHNGGDRDADNNGGPSDGDGNI